MTRETLTQRNRGMTRCIEMTFQSRGTIVAREMTHLLVGIKLMGMEHMKMNVNFKEEHKEICSSASPITDIPCHICGAVLSPPKQEWDAAVIGDLITDLKLGLTMEQKWKIAKAIYETFSPPVGVDEAELAKIYHNLIINEFLIVDANKGLSKKHLASNLIDRKYDFAKAIIQHFTASKKGSQ